MRTHLKLQPTARSDVPRTQSGLGHFMANPTLVKKSENLSVKVLRRKRTMIPMKKPLKGGFFAAPISTTAKEYLDKNILEQQKSLAHKEQ